MEDRRKYEVTLADTQHKNATAFRDQYPELDRLLEALATVAVDNFVSKTRGSPDSLTMKYHFHCDNIV